MREDDIKLVVWVRFWDVFPCWGVSMSPPGNAWQFVRELIYGKWYDLRILFSIKNVPGHKCVKYTCSMETVQQNGGFKLFSS